MKKVLSVVLALAMVLALAVPAFATDNTSLADIGKAATGASTDMKGETKVPTIDIVVPKNASIIVNPYQISVTPTGGTATQDTVISPVYYITNKSDIKLDVGMTVTGKAGSGVSFADAAPTSSETANAVYLKFEAAPTATQAEPTWASATGVQSVKVTKTAQKLEGATGIKMDAASTSTPNYIAYHVSGSAATAPTKPWTTAMTAGVTVAFTFKPIANTVGGGGGGGASVPADVTIAMSKTTETTKAANDTDTLTVTLSGANAGGVTIQSVTWVSSDTNEVTVTANGSDDKQGDVTIPAGATTGNTATVTANVTLSNGATTSVSCAYTIA